MAKNMVLAFIFNLIFSVFELVGGFFTGSVAIWSDALHDFGDAVSIGVSCCLEKMSNRQPNEVYTYGYRRYSVLGGLLTTLILLVGSVAVIISAVGRIIAPKVIHYNSMIVFAVVGVLVNGCAAFLTREGDSVNQKAINLHMLEDVLGWAVVLLGGIVMKFTDFYLIDPILSIGVGIFILINAGKNLKNILDIFLEKAPEKITGEAIRSHLMEIEEVTEVHHIHLWSMDGETTYATMHVVTDAPSKELKEHIREHLKEHGISHVTLEIEGTDEDCHEKNCGLPSCSAHCHHHHHHHHH